MTDERRARFERFNEAYLPWFIKWFPRLIAVTAVLSIVTVIGYALSSH